MSGSRNSRNHLDHSNSFRKNSLGNMFNGYKAFVIRSFLGYEIYK